MTEMNGNLLRKARFGVSRRLSVAVALVFCTLGVSAGWAQNRVDDTEFDVDLLEKRLDQLKLKEHSLRRLLAQGQTEAERLHERVVLRGRAYYRLTRGFPATDFMEHAVRVERLRQGLLSDMTRLKKLENERNSAGKTLELLEERRAPLELERRAAGEARDALLSQQERQRAFDMAFLGSAARPNHTAVYSAGAQLDLSGESFARMRGHLPFPVPGRTEIEQVKMPYAAGPGLVLRASLGAVARAVFPGRVAFADEYADYGKTVILDHGEGYFTVTAGLGSLLVQVGDDLPQSARLGQAGTNGGMSQVYFEVRENSQTLPPGPWFGI